MSLRKILSLSLLLILSSLLVGVNENAGTTGFNNLQVIYSARAMGMARAMTGFSGVIEGMQFNPASVLQIEDKVLSSTFSSYVVESSGGALHFLYPKNENVTYGVMLHYLNFGQIDRTEVTSGNEYLDLGETFGASNIMFGLTAARMINPSIDLGVSLKAIYDNIDTYSAAAVVLDGGLVHHPENEKIQVGIAIRNLGTQVAYYTEDKYKEGLPLTFAAGISYQLKPSILAAIDISKPKASNLSVKFGAEGQIHPMLKLRGGYNTNSADWKTGGDWDWSSGFTFGVGFNWKNYVLDYGVASYGNLGFVNQLTLQYQF